MIKRILSLVLCFVLAVGLVACGETPQQPSDTAGSNASVAGSNTSVAGTASDTSGDSSSSDDPQVSFDPLTETKVIVSHYNNPWVSVYDVGKCLDNPQKLKDDSYSLVWRWEGNKDPNAKLGNLTLGRGTSEAKIRYSAHYGKDVVLVGSSGGWAGIVDYENRTLLWETDVGVHGLHAMDLLPNGDLIVARYNNEGGWLSLFSVTQGKITPTATVDLYSAHGVCYDAENNIIWGLGFKGVYGFIVYNLGKENAKLIPLSDKIYLFPNNEAGGHAFAPAYGEPGKYWASNSKNLYKVDVNTGTMTKASSAMITGGIKGAAGFPNGVMVQTFMTNTVRVITRQKSKGKVSVEKDVATEVVFDDHVFYKINPFSTKY